MSVSPREPQNLPRHRRPPEHGGTGDDPVWVLEESDLPAALVYRPDPDDPRHGFIEPARMMPFEDYEQLLNETRSRWRRV
jgi:hypothetical protein